VGVVGTRNKLKGKGGSGGKRIRMNSAGPGTVPDEWSEDEFDEQTDAGTRREINDGKLKTYDNHEDSPEMIRNGRQGEEPKQTDKDNVQRQTHSELLSLHIEPMKARGYVKDLNEYRTRAKCFTPLTQEQINKALSKFKPGSKHAGGTSHVQPVPCENQ